MNKSAKEMFEELGYIYQESYFESELEEIKYVKNKRFASCIIFNLNHKCFKTFRFDDENKSCWCDKSMMQAINQQVKELGWLNEL